MLLVTLAGWINRHQHHVTEYLMAENRVLKGQLTGRRLQLTDAERRRLAAKGRRLGRRRLRQAATLVTPDTILRWHRQLIARKWTFTPRRPGRPGIMTRISSLIVRMATENPGWGYTRIQGALKNLGPGVARSTVAKVLKANGIPPAPDRPSSWRTFLRAHWGTIAGADFFHPRGLDPERAGHLLYAVRARSPKPASPRGGLDTHSGCRVHGAGGAGPDRSARWVLAGHRILICDRDRKWTEGFRRIIHDAGVQIVRTPVQAPNANADAERFVRSIRAECLDRLILLGERRRLRAVDEFVAHYPRGAEPSGARQ